MGFLGSLFKSAVNATVEYGAKKYVENKYEKALKEYYTQMPFDFTKENELSLLAEFHFADDIRSFSPEVFTYHKETNTESLTTKCKVFDNETNLLLSFLNQKLISIILITNYKSLLKFHNFLCTKYKLAYMEAGPYNEQFIVSNEPNNDLCSKAPLVDQILRSGLKNGKMKIYYIDRQFISDVHLNLVMRYASHTRIIKKSKFK